MADYLYRLVPPTQEGPYPSERQLLNALQSLHQNGELSGRQIVAYREVSIGRKYVGKINASAAFMAGEVDRECLTKT